MGQTSPINITGLTDLADYNIYVVAFKNTLQGIPSTTGTYRAYSFPIMNTVTTVTPSDQQLALGFTTSNLTGGTFQYFKIYNNDGSIYATNITGTVSSGNASGTQIISGLVNGTTYNYKVSVVTTEGTPAITQESRPIDISGIPFTTPTLSSGGTVLGGTTSGSLTIAYTVNATTNGGTIKEYRRYTNNADTSSVGPLQTITTTATSATFTVGSLINGTAYPYDFYVVVENRGSTLMSAVQKISATAYTLPTITGAAAISAPTIISSTQPSDFGKITITTGTISTGGTVTNYKIYLHSNANDSVLVGYPITTPGNSFTITLTEVSNGNRYIRVSAINPRGESGTSSKSNVVNVTNLPTFSNITLHYTPNIGYSIPNLDVSFNYLLGGNSSIDYIGLMRISDLTQIGFGKTANYTSFSGSGKLSFPIDSPDVTLGSPFTGYIRPVFKKGTSTYTPSATDSSTYRIPTITLKNKPDLYVTSGNGTIIPSFIRQDGSIFQLNSFNAPFNGGDTITSYIIYALTTTNGLNFYGQFVSKEYNASNIYDGVNLDMRDIDGDYDNSSQRPYNIYRFKIRAVNSLTTASEKATPPGAYYDPPVSFE
jgi:hypothetical protein